MLEFLEKLRQKSKKTRKQIAGGFSVAVTALIFVMWVTVLSHTPQENESARVAGQQRASQQVASPLAAFGNNARAAFEGFTAQFSDITTTAQAELSSRSQAEVSPAGDQGSAQPQFVDGGERGERTPEQQLVADRLPNSSDDETASAAASRGSNDEYFRSRVEVEQEQALVSASDDSSSDQQQVAGAAAVLENNDDNHQEQPASQTISFDQGQSPASTGNPDAGDGAPSIPDRSMTQTATNYWQDARVTEIPAFAGRQRQSGPTTEEAPVETTEAQRAASPSSTSQTPQATASQTQSEPTQSQQTPHFNSLEYNPNRDVWFSQ